MDLVFSALSNVADGGLRNRSESRNSESKWRRAGEWWGKAELSAKDEKAGAVPEWEETNYGESTGERG